MLKFELNDEQMSKLSEHMQSLSGRSEEVINRTLKQSGAKEMIQAIVGFIPLSKGKGPHAKNSNPIKVTMINLGFELKPKPKFKYLVFPDQGIGRRNQIAQRMFEKGAEQSNDKILNLLIEALIEENNKLGGK